MNLHLLHHQNRLLQHQLYVLQISSYLPFHLRRKSCLIFFLTFLFNLFNRDMRLFEMLVFIIRIIWILPNIWLMFICLKRFILIVNGWLFNIIWQNLRVHDKITDDWHTNDIRVRTSDIRVYTSNIWVTYGCHTTTYEWHTDDIRLHTSTYEWHTDDIRVTYKW